VLDQDHFGLEKVKERINRVLAVRKLKNDMLRPYFVLRPSWGRQNEHNQNPLARALDKKFVRMSLGGVRDEAEIRGTGGRI
jgi:ATP-dependent Lon protease